MTDRESFDPHAPIEDIGRHMEHATKAMRLRLICERPEKERPGERERLERELGG